MIVREQAVALKYAKAFLNVFIDEVSLDDYKKITVLEQFLKKRRDALAFLALPHLDSAIIEKSLGSVIEKFELPECFNRLVRLLIKGRRAFLFSLVLSVIAALYRKRKKIENFVIRSSYKLDDSALDVIKNFLEQKTGTKVFSRHELDKRLIAGIRLKSDHYLWEYSVAKKLRTLTASPLK